jgi:adenine specific DNA methylase Mod
MAKKSELESADWHASHQVKVMLDQIFGENNFQNAN